MKAILKRIHAAILDLKKRRDKIDAQLKPLLEASRALEGRPTPRTAPVKGKPGSAATKVLDVLRRSGELDTVQIAKKAGISYQAAHSRMQTLMSRKLVTRRKEGGRFIFKVST